MIPDEITPAPQPLRYRVATTTAYKPYAGEPYTLEFDTPGDALRYLDQLGRAIQMVSDEAPDGGAPGSTFNFKLRVNVLEGMAEASWTFK